MHFPIIMSASYHIENEKKKTWMWSLIRNKKNSAHMAPHIYEYWYADTALLPSELTEQYWNSQEKVQTVNSSSLIFTKYSGFIFFNGPTAYITTCVVLYVYLLQIKFYVLIFCLWKCSWYLINNSKRLNLYCAYLFPSLSTISNTIFCFFHQPRSSNLSRFLETSNTLNVWWKIELIQKLLLTYFRHLAFGISR